MKQRLINHHASLNLGNLTSVLKTFCSKRPFGTTLFYAPYALVMTIVSVLSYFASHGKQILFWGRHQVGASGPPYRGLGHSLNFPLLSLYRKHDTSGRHVKSLTKFPSRPSDRG